ncbi:MAG TPA: cyclic nucleotide-binding domain-containing protein [Thermoplasmata archaeon]|nr:cyclic nucleotide-binding domain-containing protein [Thermoplasmata archaeon]
MTVVNEVWYGVVTNSEPLAAPSKEFSGHPQLKGLDRRFLEALGRASVEVTYDPGNRLFRQGEAADRFFLVTKGRVALELTDPGAHPTQVGTVGPGEALGPPSTVDGSRWQYDGRALETTEVTVIDARALDAAMETWPTAGFRFLRRVGPKTSDDPSVRGDGGRQGP